MTVTVTAVDDTHFGFNGRSLPRVYIVEPLNESDAQIVNMVTLARQDVPLGSSVASATPTTQAGLIAALAAVVMPAPAA